MIETPEPRRSPDARRIEVGGVGAWVYPTPSRGRAGWTVCYRFAGRRVRKWFADGARAEKFATAQAGKIGRGQTAELSLTASDAAAYTRAAELLKATGLPIEVVAADYAAAWRELGLAGARPSFIDLARDHVRRVGHQAGKALKSVSEVVDEFLTVKSKVVHPRWQHQLSQMLARFAAAFRLPVNRVTGADLQTWLDALKADDGAPLGARSRCNYRDAAAALLNFAQTRHYLPKDYDELAGVELPPAGAGKIAPYAPEELALILTHARAVSSPLLPFISIQAFTAIRTEEMSRLRSADVRGKWIALSADITKTARRRLVAVPACLRAWLRVCALRDGPVLPWPAHAAAARLVDLVRAAGVRNRHNGLRDACITYRMALLQDAARVADESGNSPAMIARSYREVALSDGRLVTRAVARAWFAVVPARRANIIILRRRA